MRSGLILLGITALACKGKDAPPAPGLAVAGSDAPHVTPGPTVVPNAAPDKPVLPAVRAPRGSGSPPANDDFAAEKIDPDWKRSTESHLKAQFATLDQKPSDIDCKETICELTFAGSQEDLSAAMDELPKLQDEAQSVLLGAPTRDAKGLMTLHAYVRYSRNDN